MTDSVRNSGSANGSAGGSADVHAARQAAAAPERASSTSTPEANAARQLIDASRQGGVVNPGELARDLAAAYARDSQAGTALHAAVNAQLSVQDQQSLSDNLAGTLGAVAGSTGALPDRVPVYRVEGAGNQRLSIGANGSLDIPHVNTRQGLERNLYINVDDPARARAFADQRGTQFTDNTIKSVEVPRSYLNELRAEAVPESVRRANPERPVIADPTRARDQFGLAGPQIDRLREVAAPGTARNNVQPSAWTAPLRAAGHGALVGAAADAALTTVGALRDGRLSADETGDVLASSARGAAVGATYAVTERGLVQVADRIAGPAIHNATAAAAVRMGAADAVVTGAAVRTAATRVAGAGAAGAVISAGFSVYENRQGLASGDSAAIGRVAGDTVVGAGAALSGVAAGAAIGSVVPVVGTAVGAVVGLGVGLATDYVLRAGGVDQAVAQAVTSGVDAVKGAAGRVASWLGW